MPALLTHDFFGKDAYSQVAERTTLVSLAEHDAFLLGNQGPDPLFYLVADPRVSASNRIGPLMHHSRPARLLTALHDSLSMVSPQERSVARAYAAGFVCHYLLDSTMHPLVFAQQHALCAAGVDGLDKRHGGYVHAEIERELDEMVLFGKTGLTVRDYRPYRETLHADGPTLETIDRQYFYLGLWGYSRTLDHGCFSSAVRSFRRVQRLFYSPGGHATRVLAPLERLMGGKDYSLFQAMAHRPRAEASSVFSNEDHKPWTCPFTGVVRTEGFSDLYARALGHVGPMLDAFFDPTFDDEVSEKLTAKRNFSGEVVDPIALEEEG